MSSRELDYIHTVIAGWDIVRNYKRMSESARRFEKRRPKLIQRMGIDPEKFEMPSLQLLNDLSDTDRIVAKQYLCDKLDIDIMDTVIDERLNATDARIIRDICANGWTNEKAAAEEDVSLSTIKRAKVHTREAFADEAQSRFASGELDLQDNPWEIKAL